MRRENRAEAWPQSRWVWGCSYLQHGDGDDGDRGVGDTGTEFSVLGQELLISSRPHGPGRGSDTGTQGAKPVRLNLFLSLGLPFPPSPLPHPPTSPSSCTSDDQAIVGQGVQG